MSPETHISFESWVERSHSVNRQNLKKYPIIEKQGFQHSLKLTSQISWLFFMFFIRHIILCRQVLFP